MNNQIPKAILVFAVVIPVVIAVAGNYMNLWQAPFDKALASAFIIGASTSLVLFLLFYFLKRNFLASRLALSPRMTSGLIFGLVIGLIIPAAGEFFGLFDKSWESLVGAGLILGLILGIIGRLIFRQPHQSAG